MTNSLSSATERLKYHCTEEDRHISWAFGIVSERPYLLDHVDLIDSYMDFVEACRKYLPRTERMTALGGLFFRTFDHMGHALRAALSGNYTGCVMYVHDLLETNFLLDYLMEDSSHPTDWLRADKTKIKIEYRPIKDRLIYCFGFADFQPEAVWRGQICQ